MKALIQSIKTWYQRYTNYFTLAFLIACMILIGILTQKRPKIIDHTVEIPKTNTVIIGDEKYAQSLEQIIADDAYLIDSLSRALQVKPKQIKSVDRIVTRVDTVVIEKVSYISNSDSVVISKQDPYLSILAVGKKEGSYINFSLTPDTVDITKVNYTPLFKQSYTNVYIHHSNSYFNTPNASSFQVRQRKVLFNLGVSAGYDVINRQVYLGVGIQPQILSISIYKK